MSADVVVELHGLTVAYGSVVAIEGIEGVVHAHDALALIGPNGAGKSTLLQAMLGLVAPTAGTVRILGRPPAKARGEVAYVPQLDALDPEFPVSVEQVVMMGRVRSIGLGRRPGAVDRDAVDAALERVGLVERRRDRFGVLSGGQRQRVLIARAVAQGARLLLLDEPFNGVDVPTQDVLVGVLAGLRRDGVAVVMATHDLAAAEAMCSHVCILRRRQIVFGPMSDAFRPDTLRLAFGADVRGDRVSAEHSTGE